MATFTIKGGKPLKGIVTLAGAKNAASKVLVASLLTDEPCVFHRFPKIGDVEITAELCETIGSLVSRSDSVLRIHTPSIKETRVTKLSRRNRIPILTLGPLLARAGHAEVPVLGGDKIGPRPVDIHIDALRALGAVVEVGPDSYRASAPNGLRGAEVVLRFPSVGATENTILAAVLAEGRTVIKNAAVEPEVMDIIKLLQKMGAIIELGTDRRIVIDGVDRLRGAEHSLIPDRNEAISFACLAIATGGDVLVRDARQDHLITFLNAVRRIGAEYDVSDDGIRFWRPGQLCGALIETATHPGFMTDWQQPFVSVLTQVDGESIIHETVYEDRLGYVDDLNLMGAKIKVKTACPEGSQCRFNGKGFRHTAVISGPTTLHGARLTVPDLRAGMAHVVAALIAEGESVIDGVEEIDRGYERIDERLRGLGADIVRSE